MGFRRVTCALLLLALGWVAVGGPRAAAEEEPATRRAPLPSAPSYLKPYLRGEMNPARREGLRLAVLRERRSDESLALALCWLAQAEDVTLRAFAANSLTSVHVLGAQLEQDLLPSLDGLVRDRAPSVRRALANALAMLDTKTSRALLLRLWADRDAEVRATVRGALRTRLGDVEGLDSLRSLRGVRLAAWLDAATVPIATDTAHRFVSRDVEARGVHESVELPPLRPGGEPIIAWINAEFVGRQVSTDTFKGSPRPRFLIYLSPKGARPKNGGAGRHPDWHFENDWCRINQEACEVVSRVLPDRFQRIWIRRMPLDRFVARGRNKSTR